MYWQPNRADFYVDGALQFSIIGNIVVSAPQYLIFTHGTGAGTGSVVKINYVRVWQLPPGGLPVQPFVQSAVSGNQNVSPSTVALTGVTAHNQLVIAHSVGGSPQQTITGITDTQSGVWYHLGTMTGALTGYNYLDTEIWWCPIAAPLASVGTPVNVAASIAYSGGNYGNNAGAYMGEFTGLTAADGAAVVNSGTGTTATVTTGAPSQSGDLAFAVYNRYASEGNPSPINPTPPWVSNPGPLINGGNPVLPNAQQFLSGSGAASATWVESVSAAWEVMAVLFKTH
jgi:hypothetical protein